MQTYLPYPDFAKSVEVLDDKRLNRQRADVVTILKALSEPPPADDKEHNAIRMWRGNERRLITYGLTACLEWAGRGNTDATMGKILEFREKFSEETDSDPEWLGDEEFHTSHQSHLVKLRPSFFREKFPNVRDDLQLIWPRSPKIERRTPEQREMMKRLRRISRLKNSLVDAEIELAMGALQYNLHPDTLEPLTEEDQVHFAEVLAFYEDALEQQEDSDDEGE